MENTDLLLIGGSNIDYLISAKKKIDRSVVNKGCFSCSFGGVMRNIAAGLARQGLKPYFITPIGNDILGQELKKNLTDIGVNIISPKSDFPTASYLAVSNSRKELEEGIIDNRVFASLDLPFLKKYSDLISKASFTIIDGNLPAESLSFLFDGFPETRFIVEGVSTSKITAFAGFLDRIYLLSCNHLEAEALLGKHILSSEKLVGAFLKKGIGNVIITSGRSGICYGDDKYIRSLPADKVSHIVTTNGCGDAMLSGVIYALYSNMTLDDGVLLGKKLADRALISPAAMPACSYLNK